MSAAAVSAGATVVRVSGRSNDTGSRGASSDQGSDSDFPDLISKMTSAENAPTQRAAAAMPERRGNWGSSISIKASTQSDARADAEAALAALLSGECGSATDGTDESSAASATAAPPDGVAGLAGASASPAISDWQGVLQAQGIVAMGLSAAQSAAIGPEDNDAASRAGMDAKTLMQLANGAQAAAATGPSGSRGAQQAGSSAQDWNGAASQIITAVAQETHISTVGLGAASEIAQAVPAQQDADQAPDATPGRQNAGAPINPGSSALIQATTVAQAQSMRTKQSGVDRATTAISGDGAVAMPPERSDQLGGSRGPARTIDPATGKAVRPTVQPVSAISPSQSQVARDRGDGTELANAAPVSEHAASSSYGEAQHLSGATPTPAHQVAAQIVSATEAIKSDAAGPPGTVMAAPAAAAPVVKILRLELQPADLGTITIRMSLKEDALDIRVEASRSETVRMLQQDQDALARLLTGAGYRVDGMTVVSAPTHAAAVVDGGSQAFQSSSMLPQQGGAAPQSDSRSSGGRQDPQSDPRSPPSRQDDDNEKSRSARGLGGDLFV